MTTETKSGQELNEEARQKVDMMGKILSDIGVDIVERYGCPDGPVADTVRRLWEALHHLLKLKKGLHSLHMDAMEQKASEDE